MIIASLIISLIPVIGFLLYFWAHYVQTEIGQDLFSFLIYIGPITLIVGGTAVLVLSKL